MMAVIRVRGSVKVRKDFLYTMDLLCLHKANHLALVPEKKESRKMIEKVQSFVTFGEINEETLEKLLKKRARLTGDKKLDEDFFKSRKIKSFKDLAKQLIEGKISLKALGIKPVFRLKPPSKGFERAGIKKPFSMGGALGYRATDINKLIEKMM